MTENKSLLPCCRGRLLQPHAGSEGYKNWSGRQDLNFLYKPLINNIIYLNINPYTAIYTVIFQISSTRLRYVPKIY